MRRALFVAVLTLFAFAALAMTIRPASAHASSPIPTANTVMLVTSPQSLVLEVNGTPVTAPYSFPCDSGTNRTINAPSPQVNGLVRYRFANWSDGGGQSHTISCDTSGNYTAVFLTEYGLRLDTIPSGLVLEVDGVLNVTPFVAWCSPGSMHTVFAPSPQGNNATRYVFTNWGDGGAQSHTVVCDSSRNLVAFFLTAFTTSVFSDPSTGFVIQVDSVSHDAPYQFDCFARTNRVLSVPSPQTVSGVEWRFARWSDFDADVRGIACDGPRNYTAIFERVDVTGPPQPLPEGALVFGVVLGVVVLAIVVLLVASRWIAPKGAPPAAPPAAPVGAGPLPPPAKSCPRCGSSAEADWTYCMTCGDPLH